MKILLTVLFSVFLSQSMLAADYSITATTNARPAVAPTTLRGSPAWVTNTAYAVGQQVTANGSVYVCTTAGTSHTSGTGPSGLGTATDGTVTWLRSMERPRRGLILVNDGSDVVYVRIGSAATAGVGARLNPNGGSIAYPVGGEACHQDSVWVITTTSASNNICVSEW